MKLHVFAVAVVAIAGLEANAGNCDACMENNMCVRHENAETEGIQKFLKAYKSKDPLVRKGALDDLARLNDAHLNSRSVKMARTVAMALDDTDSGTRQAALEWLGNNQHRDTAVEEIGKLITKLVSTLNRPKPNSTGKTAVKALEWENALQFAKIMVTALAKLNTPEVPDFYAKLILCENRELALAAAEGIGALRDKSLVKALIDKMEALLPAKDDPDKSLFEAVNKAFRSLSGYPDARSSDNAAETRKCTAWWNQNQENWK